MQAVACTCRHVDFGGAFTLGHQFLDFCIASLDFALFVGGGDVAVVVEGAQERLYVALSQFAFLDVFQERGGKLGDGLDVGVFQVIETLAGFIHKFGVGGDGGGWLV